MRRRNKSVKKSLVVRIDHGMHCKAFSAARFVDTGEGGG